MKFIKLFKEQTAFDEAKSTLNRPNVSLVKETSNVYLLKKKNANGYSYVDLGLPSGTLWAKYNVGATSETAYGDYFMWGSKTRNTADECIWANAPFNNHSSGFNSDYFNAHKSEWLDSKNNLKPEFDAARAIMGGDWRMPTEADFNELLSGTTNKWFANYNGTGVSGTQFTGSNGSSIFIPAADYYSDGSAGNVGSGGDVWSSSLKTSSPDSAWSLSFDSVSADAVDNFRYQGLSVRGVL